MFLPAFFQPTQSVTWHFYTYFCESILWVLLIKSKIFPTYIYIYILSFEIDCRPWKALNKQFVKNMPSLTGGRSTQHQAQHALKAACFKSAWIRKMLKHKIAMPRRWGWIGLQTPPGIYVYIYIWKVRYLKWFEAGDTVIQTWHVCCCFMTFASGNLQ